MKAKNIELRSEFGELEISNTAWAFARIAVRNDRSEAEFISILNNLDVSRLD